MTITRAAVMRTVPGGIDAVRRDSGDEWRRNGDGVMHDLPTTDEFQALVNDALPTLVREAATSESGKLYRSVLARVERPLLRQALELSGGNQLKAARLLGINRNTLRKRLRLLGLLRGPGENGRPLATSEGTAS
jgi:DNA-binding protein Fis